MAYTFISNTKYLILSINVSNRAGGGRSTKKSSQYSYLNEWCDGKTDYSLR